MAGAFRSEVLAIQKLRAKYPDAGQKTLASQIVARNFLNDEDRKTAADTGSRTFYSVYSVIRRHDAKQLATV
jgi:hypothetical protein